MQPRRIRMMVRVATLLLALWLPLAGIRATPFGCCDEAGDCDLPCCDRDGKQATVAPVLPCCRTIAVDAAPARPTQSNVENAQPSAVAPAPQATWLVASVSRRIHVARPPGLGVAAVPIYQQHCALLL
jgi:hypothetical protein